MPEETNITKLMGVREKLAQVYKDEASDDLYDNGTLTKINLCVSTVEQVIDTLKKRPPEPEP
jgi:hypothetical protein